MYVYMYVNIYKYACICDFFIILHLQRIYVQRGAIEYGIQTNGTHLKTTFISLTLVVQTKGGSLVL